MKLTIPELVKKLESASYAYYLGTSDPIMSDAEFDRLKDELVERDPNNKWLSSVGVEQTSTPLSKVAHDIPMGSLKKINAKDGAKEFQTWLKSVGSVIRNPILAVSWKLDGSSVSLRYEKGKFVQAVTRGDGEIGEDVTHNIRNAVGVPLELPYRVDISVRAEAIFNLDDWKTTLHTEAKNPRNAAAGTVRRTDGRNSNLLHCVAFNVEGSGCNTIQEKLEYLTECGFNTVPTEFVKPTEVEKVVNQTLSERNDLCYEIDGLVVAVDSIEAQAILGDKDGTPYWARAWKFPSMGDFSIIRSVTWDLGSQGTVNPVAVIDPVEVGGVTITNVTLHNMNEIERLGVMIGDKVEVIRAGDVIPKIVRVVEHGETRRKISIKCCPYCVQAVKQDGPFLYCQSGIACPGVKIKRIAKWIEKREIMFFGDSALQKLIASGAVEEILDLYKLTTKKITDAGIGAGMAAKILAEIEKSRTTTLADFIGSLSIDLLGRSEAQNLVDAGLNTLEAWQTLSPEDIECIPGFGKIKANRIYRDLVSAMNIIQGLSEVLILKEKKMKKTGSAVSGKSFCFTGAAERPRKELQQIVEDGGAECFDSVKSGLDYLVMADVNSTSSKAVKARKLGTTIITEQQFLTMFGVS